MSLLFSVLYAAHARGTHHKLAMDALQQLEGAEAEAWRRVFLKHADQFMVGAKAPDDTFKDFTNHVLHPRDNFWGGAPTKAREWYGTLVAALQAGTWPEAAYAAGVLSHYVTDPVQPFHTAQSEAENNIHRAFEWSISKSYGDLKKAAPPLDADAIDNHQGDDWLEHLVCHAAGRSTKQYEKLIAHYDINRGVVDPPSGLDTVARRILSGLIVEASAIFAKVLNRAIAESKVAPPDVSLVLDTVLATLQIPIKVLLKKMDDVAERKLVERMYDELKATGTVEQNLPEESRVVRKAFAEEVLAKRTQSNRAARFPRSTATPGDTSARSAKARPAPAVKPAATNSSDRELPIDEPARPAPKAADHKQPPAKIEPRPHRSMVAGAAAAPAPTEELAPAQDGPPPAIALAPEPPAAVAALASDTAAPEAAPVTTAAVPSVAPEAAPVAASRPTEPASLVARLDQASAARTGSQPRIRLTPGQPVVDAPSIGPVMAERLHGAGILTVSDLLAVDPDALSVGLQSHRIDAESIRDWQDQARLVCQVPGLTGTQAQLLVGAGYRSAAAVADAEAESLCAKVLAFATTSTGQRILRNGDAPDVERIRAWILNARAVKAA